MGRLAPFSGTELHLRYSRSSTEDGDGTPTPKTAGRKRGAAGSLDGETPTKKGKATKRKGLEATAAEGDDDETAQEVVKQEEGSEDELA